MPALTGQRAGDALVAAVGEVLFEQTAPSTTTYPTATSILSKLNEVQRRVATQHPWLWNQEEATIACTANTKTVTLADSCERVIGIQIQGSNQPVRYIPRNRLMLEYPGGWSSIGASTPYAWTDAELASNNALQIDLFPTPDSAYTLTLQVQKRLAAITNSSSSYSAIPPEYEDILIYATCADFLRMLSDNRADYYEAKAREISARMWMRDEQNLDGVQAAMVAPGGNTETWHPYQP